MSSNKKLFSPGLILGISLGLASSGAVYATGPITDTFGTGDTLTATHMNNIKNAVNDLQGNVPSTSCRTNAGAVDAGATRVGPLCVDNVRTGGAASWSAAVTACRIAGKRLLTPGEYIAAFNVAGGTLGMTTNGTFEWVDSVSSDGVADAIPAGGLAGRLAVGYMGPSDGVTFDPAVPAGEIFYANNASYDVGDAIIFYRCAR